MARTTLRTGVSSAQVRFTVRAAYLTNYCAVSARSAPQQVTNYSNGNYYKLWRSVGKGELQLVHRGWTDTPPSTEAHAVCAVGLNREFWVNSLTLHLAEHIIFEEQPKRLRISFAKGWYSVPWLCRRRELETADVLPEWTLLRDKRI